MFRHTFMTFSDEETQRAFWHEANSVLLAKLADGLRRLLILIIRLPLIPVLLSLC